MRPLDFWHTSRSRWNLPLVILVLLVPILLRAETVEEYAAKAALVFNFARYTDWSETAVAASPETLRVCIEGDNALVTTFQSINGRRIGQRHVQVSAMPARMEAVKCDLIFINSRDRRKISFLLSTLRDLPILTIGHVPGFTDYGGIINLYRSDTKLRFEVNLKAAKRANLSISSRLLRLARIVE